jgi:foldase protein PrsA
VGDRSPAAVNLGAVKKLLTCLLACLALSACGDLLDPAAAVVNGEKIPVDEVDRRLDEFVSTDIFERLTEQADPESLKRQTEQQTLTQLIRIAVLTPKAKAIGVEVTEQKIDERIDEIKAECPSENGFEEALKEGNITLDQLRDLVHDQLLEEPLKAEVAKNAQPTEEAIQKAYEDNLSEYSETRVQHILLKKRAEADAISQQLQSAPAGQVEKLFARLAKESSTDSSTADKGGDLGYNPAGTFVPEFEAALEKLDVGEVSDPVQTQFGFHVIRLIDRRTTPLADVRDQISDDLAQAAADKAWNDYLRDAYSEADVKVNPRYGEFDLESLVVVNASSKEIPGAVVPSTTPTPEAQVPGG